MCFESGFSAGGFELITPSDRQLDSTANSTQLEIQLYHGFTQNIHKIPESR